MKGDLICLRSPKRIRIVLPHKGYIGIMLAVFFFFFFFLGGGGGVLKQIVVKGLQGRSRLPRFRTMPPKKGGRGSCSPRTLNHMGLGCRVEGGWRV